jgi:hypothetical protein
MAGYPEEGELEHSASDTVNDLARNIPRRRSCYEVSRLFVALPSDGRARIGC